MSVSRFTTFTYSGILLGPALIGSLAQLIGLSWTLAGLLPILVCVAVASRLPEHQGHLIPVVAIELTK